MKAMRVWLVLCADFDLKTLHVTERRWMGFFYKRDAVAYAKKVGNAVYSPIKILVQP